MKIMIITSSPNINGLTEACGAAAKQGVEAAGAETVMVRLNDQNISKCHACDNAWGTCNKVYSCQVEDDFQRVHKMISEVDGLIVATPVYWGDMSESAKAFFDRLRRCEALRKDTNIVEGKPVAAIAAAGGSGNGTLTCLSTMERLFMHLKMDRFDSISITRKTREYKLEAIRSCARAIVDYINSK